HRTADAAGEHDARTLGGGRDDVGRLQRIQINDVALHLCKLREAHFGHCRGDLGAEAELRQAALQRHLAAFEADLVVTALTRTLALHATAAGLALAGGRTTAHAQARLLAARS